MKFISNILKCAAKNPVKSYIALGAIAIAAGVTYIYRKSRTIDMAMIQEDVNAKHPDGTKYVRVGFDLDQNMLYIVFLDKDKDLIAYKRVPNPKLEENLKSVLMEETLLAKIG